jgi:hypothetical protein
MNENGIAPPLPNQEKWTASNLKFLKENKT